MHAAHFIHRYPPALGGAEAYFARLSRHLSGQGHCVTVWTTTALDLTAFWSADGTRLRPGVSQEDSITVRRYDPSYWFARGPVLKLLSLLPVPRWQCLTQSWSPIAGRMLLDALRGDGPCDVVHASAFPYGWPLMCGLTRARRAKVPYLLTPFLHTGDPDDPADRTRRGYTSKPLRHLLAAADAIFVQTEIEGETIRQVGIPFDRIVLQGLGVDPAECTNGDRARARSMWQIPDDECAIGHLANLSAAKGTIDLLLASRRAWGAGSSFRVVLAGPSMPNFRRFWRNFEPKERVTLLGPLSEPEKNDFYTGIDAFCLPSRTDSFGLVFLEAWANGKPVIGYRAGGVAELIRSGEDGLLVKCGDVDSLAGALRRMASDGAARAAWGDGGRGRVACEFQWEGKLRVVEDVMGRLLSARKSSTLNGQPEPRRAGSVSDRSCLPPVAHAPGSPS
jgi:glycosyltransferase involved in cell wall biosynthesis